MHEGVIGGHFPFENHKSQDLGCEVLVAIVG